MKVYRFGTFAALLNLLAPIALGADLSLPLQSASPGSSVLISAVFAPGVDSVASLQFDLQYDSTSMSLLSVPGAATRISGKTDYYTDLSANVRRFVITAINQNLISGGSVVDLFVNLAPNTPAGLHALTISNFTTTDASGNAVATTNTNGGVMVQGNGGSRTQPSEVLNAASLTSGPVAPGEIITLIGSGIGPTIAQQSDLSATSTLLGGTSVLFDGTMAPLLYAGPEQINAIVPFGISGPSTNILIESLGEVIAGFPVSVSTVAPAIFTLNASGAGSGAILNQDLTVNSPSNPAARGSIVALYANGAGSMNPPLPDGQVTGNTLSFPNLPVSVTIGGIDAQIVYAGSAPGLVAGVLQINCAVPQNVMPGDSVSVNLTVGAASSPAGVVVSVR